MVTISSQPTRTLAAASRYAKKDSVQISAIGAPVIRFEDYVEVNRVRWGKGGVRPKIVRAADGTTVLDEDGKPSVARTPSGDLVYESKYVQGYALVQSFSKDELDPDDPASWEKSQDLARALVKDRFPGHMALIATEVNGRSGLVHNHIIVDAISSIDGKSIDSNLVTHSRLAVEHDRILAENGFAQSAEMAAKTADLKARREQVQKAVRAQPGFDALSPSQQKRQLLAAENAMRAHRDETLTPEKKREQRRQREFELYELNERERENLRALDGYTVQPERFSEIVLESRIRDVLGDPRATSWDALADLGERYGVVIDRRGSDVRYAMLREREDGSIAAGRTDTRRGKGLAEGYRIEDVEKAFVQNAEQAAERERRDAERSAHARAIARGDEQQPVDRVSQLWLQYPDEMAEEDARIRAELGDSAYADLIAESTLKLRADDPAFPATLEDIRQRRQQEAAEREAAERTRESDVEVRTPSTTAVEEEPTPRFRSRLRDVRYTGDSEKIAARVAGLPAIEEGYYSGSVSVMQLENQLLQIGGVGPRFLRDYGDYFTPDFRAVLEKREAARARDAELGDGGVELSRSLPSLKGAERTKAEQRLQQIDAQRKDVRARIAEGDYENALRVEQPAIVHEDVVAEAAVTTASKPMSEARKRALQAQRENRRANRAQSEREASQSYDGPSM